MNDRENVQKATALHTEALAPQTIGIDWTSAVIGDDEGFTIYRAQGDAEQESLTLLANLNALIFEFGVEIYLERHNQGFTRKQLAKKAGVSKREVVAIEIGDYDYTAVPLDVIAKITDALGLQVGFATVRVRPPALPEATP